MAKLKLKIYGWSLLIALILLFPMMTLAVSDLIPCDGPQGIDGVVCDFASIFGGEGLVTKVIDYTIKFIITPLATIAILYAGIRLVLPNDRPEVKTAMKNLLKTVFWGMVLVFSAYLIVQTIVTSLADNSEAPGQAALQVFD